MADNSFLLTANHNRIVEAVSTMSKVVCSLAGDTLSVTTVAPFSDEIEYGPRMDRVENVVKGLDPSARRLD